MARVGGLAGKGNAAGTNVVVVAGRVVDVDAIGNSVPSGAVCCGAGVVVVDRSTSVDDVGAADDGEAGSVVASLVDAAIRFVVGRLADERRFEVVRFARFLVVVARFEDVVVATFAARDARVDARTAAG